MDMFERAKRLLSLSMYEHAQYRAMYVEDWDLPCPDNQYILRMMLRAPEFGRILFIPNELKWAEPWINRMDKIHGSWFPSHPYMYITVRAGEVKSVTDDSWHVDGFSMKVSHVPEQNVFWCDSHPTEQLVGRWQFPEDFDPMKHNIHMFFQDRFLDKKVKTLRSKATYFIDPYVVHRRPLLPAGTRRRFVRLSFVPIEIEDDTCQHNPLMERRVYHSTDIRDRLIRYPA